MPSPWPWSKAGRRPAQRRRWWNGWTAAVAVALAVAVVTTVVVLPIVLLPRDSRDELLDPRVDLGYVVYVGRRLEGGVDRFLGMRYAAPPTGRLRWRAPVEPRRSGGVHQADQFGPICLGPPGSSPLGPEDEDCLYANVWAPSSATAASRLPVWVFIQGGGYSSNANADWSGAAVIQRSGHGLILVSFNYRAGIWGFLAGERVRRGGDLNVGLLDQRRLLGWVREHISQFGGDPDHVVIHGASAGGGSVALHMAAYGGRDDGLFVGSIAESAFFPALPPVAELEWQFDRAAWQAGCDMAADQMACLRGLDAGVLQAAAGAASAFPGRDAPPLPLFYWTPCLDGDFLRDAPLALFRQGSFVRIPLLAGNDADEGSVFAADAATQDDMARFLLNNYPRLGDGNDSATAAAIASHYPLLPSAIASPLALGGHQLWFPPTAAAYGELAFVCPTIDILDAISQHHQDQDQGQLQSSSAVPLWSYRYAVRDEGLEAAGLGVPHLSEAAAVFGPDSVTGLVPASYRSYNAPVVPVVMDYVISFVRRLDPNALRNAGAPVWEGWGGGDDDDDGDSEGGDGDNSGGDGKEAGLGAGEGTRRAGGRRLVFETGNLAMEETPQAQLDRCGFWLSLADEAGQRGAAV